MSENALWHTFRDNASPYGRFVRIESPIEPGTPDVAYAIPGRGSRFAASGWVELKHLPDFPKRSSTPIVVRKLTREQVEFAEAWVANGGRSYVLLQVRRSYYLLDVPLIRGLYERKLDLATLEIRSLAKGSNKFPTTEVVRCLAG